MIPIAIFVIGCTASRHPDESGGHRGDTAGHSADDSGNDSESDDSACGDDSCDSGSDDSTDPDDSTAHPTDEDGDGWTIAEGDCDDSIASINPAAEEIAGNGIDENCDGTGVALFGNMATDAVAILEGTEQEILAGASMSVVPDLSGDGVADLVVGAPEGSFDWSSAFARAYVVESPLAGTTSLDASAATITSVEAFDNGALSVGSPGDLDGDGDADVLYSAPLNEGIVSLFASPLSGALTVTDADWTMTGAFTEALGWTFCRLDDSEWAISAPYSEPSSVFVLTGTPEEKNVEDAALASFAGGAPWDGAGSTLAAGDLDGDGEADLVVGYSSLVGGDTGAGGVTLVAGPFAGDTTLEDAGLTWRGLGRNEHAAGYALSVPGDLDGDGYDDAVLGAHDREATLEGAGAAYIVLGEVDLEGDRSLADAATRIEGETANLAFGRAVTGVGDVDGDGFVDVAISAAPSDDPLREDSERVYLALSPPASGVVSAATLDAIWIGPGDQATGSTLAAGDVDGDGAMELLVGAPAADPAGIVDAGLVYVLPAFPF